MVPPPPPEAAPAPGAEDACHSLPMAKHPKPRPATHRCGYIPWHVLMRQLRIDVETCPRCGGKMKIIALVRNPQSIARYLRHLGLPTEDVIEPRHHALGPREATSALANGGARVSPYYGAEEYHQGGNNDARTACARGFSQFEGVSLSIRRSRRAHRRASDLAMSFSGVKSRSKEPARASGSLHA